MTHAAATCPNPAHCIDAQCYAERTARFALPTPAVVKFHARRAYVNQVCEQIGCAQDSCQNWVFPNDAALDVFAGLMKSYDVRANQGSLAAAPN